MKNFIFIFIISLSSAFATGCGSGVKLNDADIPEAIDNLQAVALSESQITLTWDDNSDNETGVRIERSINDNQNYSQIADLSPGTISYGDSGLEPLTTCYYRARAYNSAGSSAYSNETSATTLDSFPAAPDNLIAAAVSDSRISLMWTDNSDNEAGFKIERSINDNSTFIEIEDLPAGSETFDDINLNSSATYFYRVTAYNSRGVSGYSNESSATTDENTAIPAAPGSLSAAAYSSAQINLAWDDNSNNETGFKLERSTGNNSSFAQIAVLPANTVSYNNTGLDEATVYFYRVRAYNGTGDSEYSNESSAATGSSSQDQIIADHTAVDKYSTIPQEWINEVKKMCADIAGESHSSGYRIGMTLLMSLDARFQVAVFDGTVPAVSSDHLRMGSHHSTGEEDFYTNSAAIATIKNFIKNQHDAGNPLHVFGFGWCWDMTWHSYTNTDGTNTRDPVYNIHWFGSSAGGPDGDYIWGLDAGDSAITGNSVCMDTYLNAVEDYIAYCAGSIYSCKVIFTTGPVDGNSGTERGFQREIKNDYIRNYVKQDPERILFDYADILCWNNSGVKNIATWNDGGDLRTHAQIHSDNMHDYDGSWNIIEITEDGDHIGEVGALRLAKAFWWMLARIAGWNGQ